MNVQRCQLSTPMFGEKIPKKLRVRKGGHGRHYKPGLKEKDTFFRHKLEEQRDKSAAEYIRKFK